MPKDKTTDTKDNENQELQLEFQRYDAYPNAFLVFNGEFEPLEDIKDDCIVVLDTNVLLNPYEVEHKSLQAIETVYRTLAKQKRLVVPGQVAREFAELRTDKVKAVYSKFPQKNAAPRITPPQNEKYPFLSDHEEYEQLRQIQSEAIKLVEDYNIKIGNINEEYKKKASELKKQMDSWYWNDPVSTMYSEIFTDDVVVDYKLNEDKKKEVTRELARRKKFKLPPGYKDGNKTANAEGDLLIWLTILKIARERKKSLLFVTSDSKADWLHRSDKEGIYPRFELVHEFQQASGGKPFHIAKLSHLLEIFEQDKDIVSKLEKVERKNKAYLDMKNEYVSDDSLIEMYDLEEEELMSFRARLLSLFSELVTDIRNLYYSHINIIGVEPRALHKDKEVSYETIFQYLSSEKIISFETYDVVRRVIYIMKRILEGLYNLRSVDKRELKELFENGIVFVKSDHEKLLQKTE